jgi:multidrug efflux pump subunit AcrB
MYVLGFTLNMMTLLGLSLAIGLLIDDAVVVRENIFKHLERGKDAFTAALDGTKEVALSVFATTMTIVAVFLPVAFVKGLVGQFFRQFGITIAGATVLSLFVAFTLDPMLSSRFSKPIDHDKPDPWERVKRPFLRVFTGMDSAYRSILRWSVSHKLLVGAMAIGSLVFMGFIMKLTGQDFVSPEDRGQFTVTIEFPAGTSLEESSRLSRLAEDEFKKRPEVELNYATIGVDNEINKVQWRVVTSSKDQRTATLVELKDAARKATLKHIPNAKIAVTDPAFVEGAATEAPIMIDIRGNDYKDIEPIAEEVGRILRQTPGVQDVLVKYSPGRPEMRIDIDRARAADKGLTVAQIATAVRSATEGDEATKVRIGKDDIAVRVRLAKSDRLGAEQLRAITIMTPRGRVSLADVATFVRGEGPQVIEREDRQRQIVIWAAPRARPLAEIVEEIQPKLDAIKFPPGAHYAYDGQIRMMFDSNSAIGMALLLALVFIYLVLASQFESFIHPITIMTTLPLAMVGAILALFLANVTLAFSVWLGIILLMGLVTKNAILLIDRAIVRVREHGESPLQAILEAGPERLRPILMTSAAMVLGMLPTAVGRGEGSEFRGPMAIAIIGGVVSSTLLSLVVVPVFYLAIEKSKHRIGGWLGFLEKNVAEPPKH